MAKIPNTDNDRCLQGYDTTELSFIASGKQYGTATLEDNLADSYKAKHKLTI